MLVHLLFLFLAVLPLLLPGQSELAWLAAMPEGIGGLLASADNEPIKRGAVRAIANIMLLFINHFFL